jgi:hypothetical protein
MVIKVITEVVFTAFCTVLLSFVLCDAPKLYLEHCKEKGKAPARGYMAWCIYYIWVMCLLPGWSIWSNTNFLAGFAAFVTCGSFSTWLAIKEDKRAKPRAQKISATQERSVL